MSMFQALARTRTVVIGLVASVSFLASGFAHAQDWKGQGRLEGKVLGPDGTPVAGATVKLDNPARGGGPTIKTDKKGKWAYFGLVAGKWDVDVEAPGYATKRISISLASESERMNPVEIRLETAGPAPAPPEVLEAVRKADEAYKAGRFAEAQAEYEKLLALRPDLATTIHQQMGFSLIQMKKYPEALEHLQKVLDADPTNVQIRVITAQAALEGGMIDRGLEMLKSLDDGAIKTPDAFFNVGVALINANRPEDAIVYFGKSVALDAAYADGYFRRGLAYLQLGKTAEAKTDLQKFVELSPEGPEADLARKALTQLK
jgi:tetratricopeptide (TPR) repeat protein